MLRMDEDQDGASSGSDAEDMRKSKKDKEGPEQNMDIQVRRGAQPGEPGH